MGLKKILGRSKLTYEELLTAVVEVEMIIYSRPLSYISMDHLEEPSTPSHLLRLMSIPDHPLLKIDVSNTSNPALSRRMRHLNHIFWARWHKLGVFAGTQRLSSLRRKDERSWQSED